MKIKPFNNLVLVEPLEKPVIRVGGVIIPDSYIGRYIRYRVLDVGKEVNWIKEGDIVLGNPTPDNEVVNKEGHKLINSKDLFASMEE